MKNNIKRIVVVLMVVSFFLIVGDGFQLYKKEIIYEENNSFENIIELTNKSRIKNGVHPLVKSERLTKAAEAKVNDMFGLQYFNHNNPKGDSPFVFIDAVGYSYRYAGENLTKGFSCAETAHKALMKSLGHRENILNEKFNEIGVFTKSGTLNGERTILTVYFFGSSK